MSEGYTAMNLFPSRTSIPGESLDIARPSLFADARLLDHLDKGFGAAVKNRQFEVVELDDRIINADADDRREHMLGRGDEHALLHQARRVADAGDVATDRLDLEAIEVCAPEDDPPARWCG